MDAVTPPSQPLPAAPRLSVNGGFPVRKEASGLELRVLSDVGLVGLPNAGKSSLLSALSAAHPKVGAYPFTTLTPALGVVDDKTYPNPFVVADIPGLIPGASEGRGLGNQFLRHVARARLLVLVLDASEDPEEAEGILRTELYAAGLSEKPTTVVLNKIDLLDDELREYLEDAFPEAVQISAITQEGVEEFRDLVAELVQEIQVDGARVEPGETTHRVFRPGWRGMRVETKDGAYVVVGEEVERMALKTDWDSPEGVEHFQRELEKKGVVTALRRAGAEPGDEVNIGQVAFDFQ